MIKLSWLLWATDWTIGIDDVGKEIGNGIKNANQIAANCKFNRNGIRYSISMDIKQWNERNIAHHLYTACFNVNTFHRWWKSICFCFLVLFSFFGFDILLYFLRHFILILLCNTREQSNRCLEGIYVETFY